MDIKKIALYYDNVFVEIYESKEEYACNRLGNAPSFLLANDSNEIQLDSKSLSKFCDQEVERSITLIVSEPYEITKEDLCERRKQMNPGIYKI